MAWSFVHQVFKPQDYPFFPRAVLGVIPRLVFAVSLFCLPQQREFSRGHSPALSTENLSPPLSGCEANFLFLLCSTMAPCPRFSSQLRSAKGCTYAHGLSRNTPSFHMGIPRLQWLMCCRCVRWEYGQIWCSQKSDILQQLNKVNCKNQKGSLYPIWFSLS